MATCCTSCGKKFENDEQRFCSYCGAPRSVEQPKPVMNMPLQTDPKRVRVDKAAAIVAKNKPAAPRKSRFWFWLAVVIVAAAAVGCFFPASRVPFERLFAGEPFSVVFDDTVKQIASLFGR